MTEDVLPLEQDPEIQELIARALAEDVGSGDATTLALVEAKAAAGARIVARHEVIVSGMGIAAEVFRQADPGLNDAAATAPDKALAAFKAALAGPRFFGRETDPPAV